MELLKFRSLKELVYLGGFDLVIVIVIVIDFRYGTKYSRIFNQELENVKKKKTQNKTKVYEMLLA